MLQVDVAFYAPTKREKVKGIRVWLLGPLGLVAFIHKGKDTMEYGRLKGEVLIQSSRVIR